MKSLLKKNAKIIFIETILVNGSKFILKSLKEFLKLTLWALVGLSWVGLVVFLSLLPATFGIKTNTSLSITLLLIGLLSPIFIFLYFNKSNREEFIKEGKNFIIGIRQLIIFFGSLIGLLTGIIIFFVLAGTIFSWLLGLGVATLLVIIIIILLLK